ncbi:hypothetical protein [Marinobacter sp. LN3S78]|uniref:hypothetical protein n=1 Tax=Marinobacter sp. LN3S78 TaxID=3382300 RepID=UPI00387B4379
MNEAQRQFAMGVAGVRLWYARAPLPGAAPSPDFDFDEPGGIATDVPEAVSETPVARAPRPASEVSRQGLARLQGLMADTASRPGARTDNDSAPAVDGGAGVAADSGGEVIRQEADAGPQADAPEEQASRHQAGDALAGEAVAFHWRFWLGGQWLLVSRCPDNASRALEDRLATNILKALGEDVAGREEVRWPVFSNPAVPGNDAAGAVDVLSAMAETVARPRQVWLGLVPEDSAQAATGVWDKLCAPLGQAAVSFPLSLAALSSDPDGKRRLWQALQQIGRA